MWRVGSDRRTMLRKQKRDRQEILTQTPARYNNERTTVGLLLAVGGLSAFLYLLFFFHFPFYLFPPPPPSYLLLLTFPSALLFPLSLFTCWLAVCVVGVRGPQDRAHIRCGPDAAFSVPLPTKKRINLTFPRLTWIVENQQQQQQQQNQPLQSRRPLKKIVMLFSLESSYFNEILIIFFCFVCITRCV